MKDFQPWALSAGDSIQVTWKIVTGADGHALLQVSDGSTVEVYPNSQFVFRKNPGNWRDLIDLFLGRVRVHIEHLGTTPNPNRVLTPVAVISVRGTTFDVTVNDDDEATIVEVEDGTVEVQHALLGGNAILNAGEVLRVYRDQQIAQRMDKGGLALKVARVLINVAAIVGRSSGPGAIKLPGGGGGGTVGIGDTGPKAPPPSAPPPPPAPPKLP